MTSRPAGDLPHRHVAMIVVAHPVLRNAIYESLLLMQPDWEHVEAADAEQALALAAARRFDIALVDSGIAPAGAEQTVRALKALAPRVEIIVLTNSTDPSRGDASLFGTEKNGKRPLFPFSPVFLIGFPKRRFCDRRFAFGGANMSHVMNTYARQPVAFVRGQGVWLWDEQGRKYLDALAGIAVNTLGHNHPRLVRALTEQLGRAIHTSNLFQQPLQEAAADRIAEISGLDEVFFCNSGLEANEAAIKVARKYGHGRGVEQPAIIVMENAFHGRSLATLSASGSRKVQAGFEPLVQGFVRVPLNDLDAVRQVAAHDKNVVAVLIEPIQGEGGINLARLEYLRGLKEICDRQEWLFISDEIQCGLGRTGRWFVYQHAGFLPDVLPLAKGLGSGVPVGACVLGGRAKGVFKPGNHGSTFGGNPLAMTAVITTLDTMKDEALLANAARVGGAMRDGLSAALGKLPGVVEVRGNGLMIGIELDRACGDIVKLALEAGLVANVTAEKVIRLLPPLIVSDAEGREVVERLVPLVRTFLAAGAAQPQAAAAH